MNKKRICGISVLFVLLLLLEHLTIAISLPHPPSRPHHMTPNQEDLNYTWIWDELSNAPGQIVGEDVVFWGENLGPYHNYTELTRKLLLLNESFPEIVDVFSIGKTWEGREIWCVRLTYEVVTDAKTANYIVAAHHARELITVENALYFIDRIVYNETMFGTFTDLLEHTEIYVIPMLNPDGISIMHKFPAQRKNMHPIDDDEDGTLIDEEEILFYWDQTANTSEILEQDIDDDGEIGEDLPGGVDLNRNYAAFWNSTEGASDNKHASNYRGDRPFSELETQAMRDFMLGHDFNFAVSLHSGVRAIIAPLGYNLTYPQKDAEEFEALVSALENITGFPRWEEIPYHYVTSGEWGDYCYMYHHIRPFTIETYGYSNSKTWFDYFNPPGSGILSNSELIFKALIYLMEEPRLTYSNTLPEVEVYNPPALTRFDDEYTIRWRAYDYENSNLNFSVYVSKDGLNWTMLATNIVNSYTYTWNLSNVEPGAYLIKVSANDGKDSIQDISETRIYVKQNPERNANPMYVWLSAVIFGVVAFLYYLYQTRKAKQISSWYTKEEKN